MTDKLKKKPATRRDAVDAARLKLAGDPSHINASEDALLRAAMPEAHGRVVTSGLLAEAGRRGDDRVTLLIPEEAALLKARGGSGAVNPLSGLLEYNNGSDSDNTSAAGENTGGMDTSSPNSGVTGNEGPSASNGGNSGSYSSDYGGFGLSGSIYSTPSIANMSLAQMESISKQINDDIDSNYQGMFGTGHRDHHW